MKLKQENKTSLFSDSRATFGAPMLFGLNPYKTYKLSQLIMLLDCNAINCFNNLFRKALQF